MCEHASASELHVCMNALRVCFCHLHREVISDPYCVQRIVCERQANIAGVGRSRLATKEAIITSHSNGSDKSDQYENNTDQIWNIQANKPSQYIRLYIATLDIETSPDCSKDYLLIQDSPCSNTHRLCGSMSDVAYIFTTGQLQIKFSTDGDTTGRGFTALYSIVNKQAAAPEHKRSYS